MTSKFPPTYYVTCTGDFLEHHAPKLGAALVKNKVPHEFHYYGDEEHELGHVFMLRIKEEDARICNDEECDYFRRMMR